MLIISPLDLLAFQIWRLLLVLQLLVFQSDLFHEKVSARLPPSRVIHGSHFVTAIEIRQIDIPKEFNPFYACAISRCEVKALWKLAFDFSTFGRFLEGNIFRKSSAKSKRNDQFQPGKSRNIFEHFSYWTRYRKMALTLYSWSGGLSNTG